MWANNYLSDKVESITGYQFQNKNLLREALTAAGADVNNHDGNRGLALVGKALVELCSVKFGYYSRAERSTNTTLKIMYTNNERCAYLAKMNGIDQLLTYCERSGGASRRILNIAANALIGAIYIDSKSEDATLAALHKMGWFCFNETSELSSASQENNGSSRQAEQLTPASRESEVAAEASGLAEGACLGNNTPWQSFLNSEAQRCVLHGIPPPQETYFEERLQQRLRALQTKHEALAIDLCMLFLVVGGPQSFAGFQANIKGAEAAACPGAELYSTHGSAKEHFRIIVSLDKIKNHLDTVQSYHIWRLYRFCSEQQEPSGLRITSYQHNEQTRRSGNPMHLRESETTQRMVDAIFSKQEQSSMPDRSIYTRMTELRRKGKKLQSLINHFDTGIIGLMHCHPIRNCSTPNLSALLNSKIPDKVFNELVSLLETHQGRLIRKVSSAFSPLVEQLVGGRFEELKKTRLMTVSTEELLRYPKGSDHLLQFLVPVRGENRTQ